MSSLEGAIRRAQDLAPSFAGQIEQALRAGDFNRPLGYTSSGQRITMLKAIWAAVPQPRRAELLAEGLSCGDALCHEWAFIVRAMRDVRASSSLILGGPDDQAFFDNLPPAVNVYRGTTQAELDDAPAFGVSWTTKRAKALWFAKEHGRYRRMNSPPILLSQTIAKADIAGVANGRDEHEIFVDPAITDQSRQAGGLVVSTVDPQPRMSEADE